METNMTRLGPLVLPWSGALTWLSGSRAAGAVQPASARMWWHDSYGCHQLPGG